MPVIITAIALVLLIILPAGQAAAAIYSYKDASGRTVFVDDEQKIPAQFRGNTTTLQEQLPQSEPAKQEGDEDKPAAPPAQATVDRESQMRARQQVEMLDRERAYQTPIMVRGNRVLVPVEVAVDNSTKHLMLLLDTGATTTVLHRAAVKELPFAPGEQIAARVAGGRTVKSEKVVTRHIDIGPFVMKDFPVMLITPQGSALPFDGMLGMDFLKDHPHEIDYANEMIRWKPVDR